MPCTAETQSGAPCRAQPLANENRCFAHADSPASVARRDAARKAGGAGRGAQLRRPNPPTMIIAPADDDDVPLATLGEVEEAQRVITLDLLSGRLSAREALARTKCLGALASRIQDVQRAERAERAEQSAARTGRGW